MSSNSNKKKRSANVTVDRELEEDVPIEELEYEDPYGDEYDSEDFVFDGVRGADGELVEEEMKESALTDENVEIEGEVERKKPKVWLKSKHGLSNNEKLTYDASAYDMLHGLRVDWPCLSVSILPDKLGQQRQRFPHTVYAVAGTQADQAIKNKLLILKMSDLHKTKHDEDSDDSDDEASGGDEDAKIVYKSLRHNGCINRLKAMPQFPHIISTWSETSNVHIWNVKKHIDALDNAAISAPANPGPTCTLKQHRTEGFAMDWSSVTAGRLITGDCSGGIFVSERQGESGKWSCDKIPFEGHNDSVEDLQWSPTEADVFASCSVDKTIKIWDTRKKTQPALSVNAHDTDVNVIGWNKLVTYLVVSGADDGSFRIWDLRTLEKPAAHFKWHTQPISSVEWSPDEDSVLAVACAEQISIWDLSLERDTDAQAAVSAQPEQQDDDAILPENLDEVDQEVPPQLLFVHQGQTDIKDVHWHPQIPGALLSTAEDGLNVWKPSNIGRFE